MKVLDHGYVDLVETWGSDSRIIEAARMSTQKGFEGWGPECKECRCNTFEPKHKAGGRCPACGTTLVAGDERLLAYLWKNNHATPFEMGGAVIEVQAPIFVFREWHRHRTQSYNEMSARYAPLPDVNYVPSVERLMLGGGHLTKQAAGADGSTVLDEWHAKDFQRGLVEKYAEAERLYQWSLKSGVPKELARLVLPVGRYSRMRASANLRNWLGFLTLRMAHQAQWEIRQYAEAVHEILAPLFPRTVALFDAGSSSPTSTNPSDTKGTV